MVFIHKHIYEEIRSSLSKRKPECGGVLGAAPGQAISKFYFEISGKTSADAYTPDYEAINTILEEWANDGVQMVGMIHSHDKGDFPSCGDLFYCEQILQNNPTIQEFLLPIVTLCPFTIHMFRVRADQKLIVAKDDMTII